MRLLLQHLPLNQHDQLSFAALLEQPLPLRSHHGLCPSCFDTLLFDRQNLLSFAVFSRNTQPLLRFARTCEYQLLCIILPLDRSSTLILSLRAKCNFNYWIQTYDFF